MTYPRAMTVHPTEPGLYHCISRCVRRAWLCGTDRFTGRDYNHRRGWIESRLIKLAEHFAVGVYAWSVMSNHTHIVLCVDPRRPWQWSDETVARHWCHLTLSPGNPGSNAAERFELRVAALTADTKRLEILRGRLGSISWFMRFLNEYIARLANAEDRCTGRFWQGRFRCQALLDHEAILACMAYVDLNPARAGLCSKLSDSPFTSIRRRLVGLEPSAAACTGLLEPLAGQHLTPRPNITLGEYIKLLRWCMERSENTSPPVTPSSLPSALNTMRWSPHRWLTCLQRIESGFGTAVGHVDSLKRHAAATGRAWLRGFGLT